MSSKSSFSINSIAITIADGNHGTKLFGGSDGIIFITAGAAVIAVTLGISDIYLTITTKDFHRLK